MPSLSSLIDPVLQAWPLPRFRTTLILLSSVLLSIYGPGCSSDGGPAGPEDEGHATTGVATITPANGGDVTAVTENGTRVTLMFPPGAVRVPTQVTVRPEAPAAGNWMTVSLEPEGMVFYQPFDIEVTLPGSVDVTDAQMFLRPDDPVNVPTEVNGHTLTGSLTFFGFTADSTWAIPSVAARSFASVAGSGNQLAAGDVDCAQVIADAQQSFNDFLAQQNYDLAVQTALDIAALLQKAAVCTGAETWIQQAGQIACDQLDAAIQTAQSTPTLSYGDFVAQSQAILHWAVLVQKLSPSCPSVFTYFSTLDAEITDFVAFFEPRLNGMTAYDWPTFLDLKEEAESVFQFMTAALSFGLLDAYDLLESKAFFPTIDKMRAVAFEMCRSDGWHYPLSRLTSTGFFAGRDIYGVTPPRPSSIVHGTAPSRYASFTNDDIYEDLQYCAMCLAIEPLVASGGKLDSTTVGGNGAPGSNTTEATVNTPTRGTIKLGGRMGAFTCWDDVPGDKELVIALDGVDVLTLRRPIGANDYLLGGSEMIDIGAAAAAAGITPKEGNTSDLTFRRRRSDCDARMWGPDEYSLAAATLKWQNPSLEVTIEFPDQVPSGTPTPVDVKVGVIDQLGGTSYFPNILVDLDVVGGGAAAASGQTDANGYFHTTLTADGARNATGGLGGSPALTMTITAQATSFEGVTAQNQKIAGVSDEGTATITTASRFIHVTAKAGTPVDFDDATFDSAGVFGITKHAHSEQTVDGRNATCTSDATISSDLQVESGLFTGVTAAYQGSASGSASALVSGEYLNGGANITLDVTFEVHDKPMPYTVDLTGTVAGGSSNVGLSLGGDFGDLQWQDESPSASLSGMLDPGTYRFIISMGVGINYDVNYCLSGCSDEATLDLNCVFTLGSQGLAARTSAAAPR